MEEEINLKVDLSPEKAYSILLKAKEEVSEYPFIRLGQAIMNRFTGKEGEWAIGTKYDIFYLTDNCKAERMFLDYYVDYTKQ